MQHKCNKIRYKKTCYMTWYGTLIHEYTNRTEACIKIDRTWRKKAKKKKKFMIQLSIKKQRKNTTFLTLASGSYMLSLFRDLAKWTFYYRKIIHIKLRLSAVRMLICTSVFVLCVPLLLFFFVTFFFILLVQNHLRSHELLFVPKVLYRRDLIE